ncbi:MAG: RlmE family RNA methyltransferase [Pseudomonadales bacterium]
MTRRSASSHRWLARQRRDVYARKAAEEGQISRAHFKLEQLDERFKLLRRGLRVLELGAAPGGWTRYVEGKINPGCLVACDQRPIAACADTRVVAGWYGDAETDHALALALEQQPVDLVLSDMAPNMSGIRSADQARAMALADLALEAAMQWLRPGGDLVVKLFQGEGSEDWLKQVRYLFSKVYQVKPKASRPDSREVYVVARERRADRTVADASAQGHHSGYHDTV